MVTYYEVEAEIEVLLTFPRCPAFPKASLYTYIILLVVHLDTKLKLSTPMGDIPYA